MEPVLLCWMFDKRWLCGIGNSCKEFLLLAPIAINIASLVAVLAERSTAQVEVDGYVVVLITLYGLLALACLFLLVHAYHKAERQLQSVTENVGPIREFSHQFEIKRQIWSWPGLVITLLALAQIIINRLYILANTKNYNCITNQIRFWIDIAAWAYIVLIIVVFLLCKLSFLFFSWKQPERYLQYKGVI